MKLALMEAFSPQAKYRNLIPPLGLAYLAAYLDKFLPGREIECRIFETPQELLNFNPDLAGISAMTENMAKAEQLAGLIKSSLNIPVILGGAHISALPQALPLPFAVGVLGEGEENLLSLLGLFLAGDFNPAAFNNLPGICYQLEGKTIVNKRAELIKPLDEIPPPSRELLNLKNKTFLQFSSRGCPYDCSFCASRNTWLRYRSFSPQYVVAEMAGLIEKYNPSYIYLADDLFLAEEKRLEKIVELMREKELLGRLTFSGSFRADLINEHNLALLKQMGFTYLFFGAESGSDRVLQLMHKQTTVSQNQRAINLCYLFGIGVEASFIIGYPGESKEDIEMTYDFIRENQKKLSAVGIGPLVPLPGTSLWSDCSLRLAGRKWENLRLLDMDEFEPENYLYLNPAMDYPSFLVYAGAFRDLYLEINREVLKQLKKAG